MKDSRKKPSKSISNAVMNEYRHLCAVCASPGPQLHHIDENPANSISENLIPLCPNCHLRDQHNPTQAIEIRRLQLFRKFKDPSILSSQFQPLFKRLEFLDDLGTGASSTDGLSDRCEELCRFVEHLVQGVFYAGEIKKLTKRPSLSFLTGGQVYPSGSGQDRNINYRRQLNDARDRINELAMELLRYQDWPYKKI